MFRFERFATGALIASLLSACAGSGGSSVEIPRASSAVPQSPSSDTRVTETTTQTAAIFHIERGTAQKFRAAQSVGRPGEAVKGLRVAGRVRDYWFGEDATITRYDKYIIIRAYGSRTFVFRASDVRVIDNESGKDKDGVREERGVPVASSLASGNIHHALSTAPCPDCIVLTRPAQSTAQSQQSKARSASILLRRACDSFIEGSCDYCGADPFFVEGCCDIASLDPCNGSGSEGGYYDPYGYWITDSCANYMWDASYYTLCQSFNGGQLAVIPLMRAFRSPGVQHYNWYFDTYTVMDVLRPPNGSTGTTFNWSFNDLFEGRIFLQNVPISPASAALGEWCFYLNNTSAFNSSTVWVNNALGAQLGFWSATLGTITGVTNPNRCPV